MFRNILVKIISISYILCTITLGAEFDELVGAGGGESVGRVVVPFETHVPTDESCVIYSPMFPMEPGLQGALRRVYGDSEALTYGAYLNHAYAACVEAYPDLLTDPTYEFNVDRTPVACPSFIIDHSNGGGAVAMAVPSLRVESLASCIESGLVARFENVDTSDLPEGNPYYLPIKVSASSTFFDTLRQEVPEVITLVS